MLNNTFEDYMSDARSFSEYFFHYADLPDDHIERMKSAFETDVCPREAVRYLGEKYDLTWPDAFDLQRRQEPRPVFQKEACFVVFGSYGEILARQRDGCIVWRDHGEEYNDIQRFNVALYVMQYGQLPEITDICNIGFWHDPDEHGEYVAPELDYQADSIWQNVDGDQASESWFTCLKKFLEAYAGKDFTGPNPWVDSNAGGTNT